MASLRENRNKDGVLISFLIRVHRGRSSDGKQLKPWTTTFEVSPSWSEKTARKKAEAFAATFEKECKDGVASDSRQRFDEYCLYAIGIKANGRIKASTVERYTELAERINSVIGHIKLKDLRPDHLNSFYIELSKKGARKGQRSAIASSGLAEHLKEQKISKASIAASSKLAPSTVSSAINGKQVCEATAFAIADALGIKAEDYFSFEENSEPLSAKTILEHHRLISTVLDLAVKEGHIPFNPADRALPPVPKKKAVNYFQPETVHKILEAADKEPLKYKTFVYLCVSTGARRGELAGLKWDGINFETEVIRLDSGLLYSRKNGTYLDTTKTGNVRFIKIPQIVIDMLRQLRVEQKEKRLLCGELWNDTDFVFTRDDGEPIHPQTWTGWMKKFGEKNNLPHINPHAFRHTAASVLISKHIDIVTTSKMLGHASPDTTAKYYSHLIEEAAAAASASISDVLIKPKESKKTSAG